MSDNEYEAFEITDYDLANEFNPNRPRRKLTKNQQIYGIWADSDSDNDSEVEMTGRRRGKAKGRSSGPVSFVTGGIQQPGSFKKADKDQDKEENNQITDEDDELPVKQRLRGDGGPVLSNSSSDEESAAIPKRSGFGMQQPKPSTSSKPVGVWEQHTKGIGAKLLLQMGYKPGKGLGKDLQGISQPVEAYTRKGRGAIGAYGPETPATVGGKHKPTEDRDAFEEREFKQKLNKWKKDTPKSDSKKSRYYYRSVEEVIEKGKKTIVPDSLSKKLGNVPVIDMTGPEKRVFSGYHAIGHTKIVEEEVYDQKGEKKATNGFALPELMHNINLILHNCEQEIISLDREERETTENYERLEKDKKNLEKVVKLEKEQIETLEKALSLVQELTSNPENLSLSRAEKIFIELQHDYPSEYKEFALGDLAAGVIAPLVNNELKSWKPLEEPTLFVNTIKKWRTILDMHHSEERNNVFDPYSSLVWAGVIPSFRAAVNEWNPKTHQKMAALLDTWAPLFPTWVLDNVLEQLVLPRLVMEVKEWDPLTDTVPIHSWILPWSSILGHKMEEFIFPTIREKLGVALQAWMPQDRSARAMLTPWKEAFDEDEMQSFLLKHIIPKLQMSLSEMIINPLQQDLELWNQVWEWNELIPSWLMAQILDKCFFPKWMQVLVLWLNQSPDFDQISRWYTGWKTVLGDELIKQPTIKEHLRRALEIMHRATETIATPQPIPPPMAAPSTSTSTGPPALMDLQITPPVQLEFKELVSQKCAERGIIFAPMPGRREFGKQVYRVGKLFCYIDRNVVMLSDGSLKNWTPSSLGLTIERAVSG